MCDSKSWGDPMWTTVCYNPRTILPLHSSVLPLHSSVLPLHSSVLPLHFSILPLHSSVLPLHSSVLPLHFSILPLHFSVFPAAHSTSFHPIVQSYLCHEQRHGLWLWLDLRVRRRSVSPRSDIPGDLGAERQATTSVVSSGQVHIEHRFPAPFSKLCQKWLLHWRGTLYLRAAVHWRWQRPPKAFGTNKTVEAT